MKKLFTLLIALSALGVSAVTLADRETQSDSKGQENHKVSRENKYEDNKRENDDDNDDNKRKVERYTTGFNQSGFTNSGFNKHNVGTGDNDKKEKKESKKIQGTGDKQAKIESKYGKKTALMVKQFEKKSSIFQQKLPDNVLLKVYPIFLEKIQRFLGQISSGQASSGSLISERINFLNALTESIQAELKAIQAKINSGSVITTGSIGTGLINTGIINTGTVNTGIIQ